MLISFDRKDVIWFKNWQQDIGWKTPVMDVMWGTSTPSRTAFNILSGVGCNQMLAGCRIEKANVETSTYSLLFRQYEIPVVNH